MKKANIHTIVFLFLISIFTVAPITTSSEEPGGVKPSGETKEKLSPADREAKAYELFDEILTLTETSDTKTVLPQIETLYFKIIREYPETALAQESYWRLISIYVDRSIPPGYEKAETLYFEFLKKYPGSVIKNMIEDTLSKSYYKNGKWDKLSKLYSSAVNEFKEKGKLSKPDPMFMYAEAEFNLGDLTEAERAYKIVIDLFPTSSKAAASKRRLEEIKKTKAKADSD
jgi:tetratricopeptide (TPR) repeat protein